jgi:hypothetical protein
MEGLVESLFLQIKLLSEQNSMLLEQTKYLMEQNRILTEKQNTVQSLENIPQNNDTFLNQELKCLNLGDNSWKSFLENVKNILIYDDIKFVEKGYRQCIIDIITRILKLTKHKPFHTLTKKSKIVALYREKEWDKITFNEFAEEIKKLINVIVHGLICKYKKQIPRCIFDETLVLMMEDTNEHKEFIANRLIENCVIIY